MQLRHGCLAVNAIGRDFEINNGLVMVRLVLRDGGYAQEFYAADKAGCFRLLLSSIHKNLIPSSEHRTCASPMISGENFHLFGVSRESLRMPYSNVCIKHPERDKATARLTGSVQGHELKCDITVQRGSKVVRVNVSDSPPKGCSERVVEYLMSSYAFLPDGEKLPQPESADCIWAPALRPANNHVIGDTAFHCPAVAVQKGQFAAALIPDIEILSANRHMPAAMDLDFDNGLLPTALLSYGFCGSEPAQDGKHDKHDLAMSRRFDRQSLAYGCYLLLDAQCKKQQIASQTARFLWSVYDTEAATQVGGQVSLPAEMLRHHSQLPDDARAAYGLLSNGLRNNSAQLTTAADGRIESLLAAPQEHGLFSTECGFQNSRTACAADTGIGAYGTAECSTQAYWLLKSHEDLKQDSRIVSMCRRYGDKLLESMLGSGAIPSWFNCEGLPTSTLRSSAQTSASTLFMARLARVTGHNKYLNGAQTGFRFVLREAAADGRMLDNTCLDPDRGTTHECRDPHTGMYPQSGWPALWSAQTAMELYELTGSKTFLRHAQRFLDRVCLLQCLCEMPWNPGSRPGMCVTGNLVRKPDAELSAEFARCAADYGAASGVREYLKRAKWALRSAVNDPQATFASRARVLATAEAIRHKLGVLYVDVTGRWAISVFGVRLDKLDISPKTIDLAADLRPNDGRVVFGRANGKQFALRINGMDINYLDDLEKGIQLPKTKRGSQSGDAFAQPTLFEDQ